MKINIFILASMTITHKRLRSYLRGRKSIVISGYSMEPADALKYMSENPGHILLIDDAFYNHKEIYRFLNKLTPPRVSERTIVYTGADEAEYVKQLVRIGITAIVHKISPKTNIIDALKLVNAGGSYIDSYFDFQLFKNQFKSNLAANKEVGLTDKSQPVNIN
jgi:DNA-binding NarL/FixJ family response regulator